MNIDKIDLIINKVIEHSDGCASYEDVRSYIKDILDAPPSPNRLQAAIAVLKEIDEYLSPNPLNQMGCESILHKKVKDALQLAAM